MRLLRAYAQGLRPRTETLLPALLFWLASALPGWVAAGPFRAGMNAALGSSPVSEEIAKGGGIDLLAELGIHQPGLWAAGFGIFLVGLLAAAAVAFFASSGSYARAAAEEGSVWRRFWPQGFGFLVPSAVVLLLNAILWGLIAIVPVLVLVGLGQHWKEDTDPAVSLHLAIAGGVAAAVLWGLFHAAAGFGRAWAALQGRSVNPAKAFLRGLAFSLKRLPQTQVLSWTFVLARATVIYVMVFRLCPGFDTVGAVLGSLALAQVGYLVAGWLKAAEIQAQVAYLGPLPEEPVRAVSAPPRMEPEQDPAALAEEPGPGELTPEAAIEG